MAKRTVLATPSEDGHLALLERVDLPPVGTRLPVTLELPEERRVAAEDRELPTRNLGPFKGRLTRDEIYADLV